MNPEDLNDPYDMLAKALQYGINDKRANRPAMGGKELFLRLGFTGGRAGDVSYFRNAYGSGYRFVKWQEYLKA